MEALVTRLTPEALLISAVINSTDPYHHKQWGITHKHFLGYRDEFEWVEIFISTYGRTPTQEEFKAQWPDVTLSLTHEDGKWPATEVIDQYNARTALRTFTKAGTLIKSGEVKDALALVKAMDIHTVVERPSNALVDYSFLDDYDEEEDTITLPWRFLQDKTDGMRQGEVWYVGARPSQGKSAHCLVMAASAAMQGRNVIIYSMEMTKRSVQIRLQAVLANMLDLKVSARDMKSRRYDKLAYKQLMQTIEERVPGQVMVHTPAEGPCRPSAIAAVAKDYDLNIVDHIGLLRPDGGGRSTDDWRTIAGMSNELKEIALSSNTRLLVASQINREGQSNQRPPKLVNLAQSDALGQDADVVLTLKRYNTRDGRNADASHFSIEKNREGDVYGQWFTAFEPDIGNYRQITREEADELAHDDWEDE
jgi:hypothetical protein